ncbi:hypothetical protein B0O99DRAFT_685607 [Bisporella sp. PMI_857]|nr:hypothetical protein B0O99DRAFT_685607 [Bisporella sp. PMI_857]
MRSFISAVLVAASAIPALAQSNITQTQVVDQSADFNLVVISDNATINGSLLGACHNGAAHEGLCLVDSSYDHAANYVSFQFNTTRNICTETNETGTFPISCNDPPINATIGQTGLLTWWLQFGGDSEPARVSQVFSLSSYPSTNVQQAQIDFGVYGVGTYVAFDENSLLNIQSYVDDTLEPAYPVPGYQIVLYRWFICKTYYTGYRYTALTWVAGPNPPQNPTCQSVNIKRVFV